MEIQRNIVRSTEQKPYIKVLFIVISIILFLVLSNLIRTGNTLWLDQVMLSFSQAYIFGSIYKILSFITNLGSKPVVISILVFTLILLWWRTRDYLGMITIAAVLIGSNELYKALKDIFQRERPIHDPAIDAIGYSFPSGHATVSMAFYGILIYFIWRYMKIGAGKSWSLYLLGFYILLMGMSRVLLQAHYISDVLAGFAVGFVYLMIWIVIYEAITQYFMKRKIRKSGFTM